MPKNNKDKISSLLRRYAMLSTLEETTGTNYMRKLARKDTIVRMSNIVPNHDDEPNNNVTNVDDTGSIDESLTSIPSLLHHSSKQLLGASKGLSSRTSFVQTSDPGSEKPSPRKNVKFGNTVKSMSKSNRTSYKDTPSAAVTPTPTGGALDNARAFLWDQDDSWDQDESSEVGPSPSPPSRMPSFRSSGGTPLTSRLSFWGQKSISGRLVGLHAAEKDTEDHQDLEETATHDDEIPSPAENLDCIVKPENGTFMKAVAGRIMNKFRINRPPWYAHDRSTNEPNLALGQDDDLALTPQNNMQSVRRMDHRPSWNQSLRDVMRDPADVFGNMPESPPTSSRHHLFGEESHDAIRKIFHRHGKLFVLMTIVLVLLIGTMYILTPRLFGQHNGSSSSLGLMNIHQRDRYEGIRRTILQSNFTSEHTLDDPTSVQNHALLWLSDYDLNQISTDSDAILQRYALATFFFSTYVSLVTNVSMKDMGALTRLNNGTKRKNYLHPKDCWTTECRKWKLEHVLDKLQTNSPNMKESVFWNSALDTPTSPNEKANDPRDMYWLKSDHWMSEKGICMWHGVSCARRIHQGQSSNQYNENSDIVSLALPDNNIVGSLPSEMAALENLEHLDLQTNFLSGTIPSSLGKVIQLTSLDLSNNRLKGSIPVQLHHCSKLENLQLGINHLNGTIHPRLFYRMNKLKKLGLNMNFLEGRLPRFNDVEGTLRGLHLEDNLFTGAIPKEYGDLLHLRLIKLNKNYLKGKLPDGMSQLSHLELFHVDTNRLSSSIPHHYFDSKTNLREIVLSNNNFEGPLPTSVERLCHLKVLSLNKNGFTGTIPVGYGEMRSLEVLDLSHNGLTGPLPNTIPKMTRLEYLRVAKNQISGTIPNAIKRLSSLKVLSLKHNFMHGTIPSEVSGLGDLQMLLLEHNSFRGTLPESMCDPNIIDIKYISADCKEDGEEGDGSRHVACNCCDRCYN